MEFFEYNGLDVVGPAALSGCRFFSNFEIPSDAMYISGIVGYFSSWHWLLGGFSLPSEM